MHPSLLCLLQDSHAASGLEISFCVTPAIGHTAIVVFNGPLKRSLHVQCVVRVDPDTGKREVAGTHWDFNSYGGELKKAMGIAPQVRAGFCLLYLQPACQSSPVCFYLSCSCWDVVSFGGRTECQELHPAATW